MPPGSAATASRSSPSPPRPFPTPLPVPAGAALLRWYVVNLHPLHPRGIRKQSKVSFFLRGLVAIGQRSFILTLDARPSPSTPPVTVSDAGVSPASSRRFTTTASCAGTRLRYGSAPLVVGTSAVSSTSFAPQGMPCSEPRYRPASISRSACWACERARSLVRVMTQCSLESNFCKRSR